MEITVESPNDFAQRPDPPREAVEALAIAGYQSGKLAALQASRLLGFGSRFEFDRFLKARNIYDHAFGVEDLAADSEALRNLDEDSVHKR